MGIMLDEPKCWTLKRTVYNLYYPKIASDVPFCPILTQCIYKYITSVFVDGNFDCEFYTFSDLIKEQLLAWKCNYRTFAWNRTKHAALRIWCTAVRWNWAAVVKLSPLHVQVIIILNSFLTSAKLVFFTIQLFLM